MDFTQIFLIIVKMPAGLSVDLNDTLTQEKKGPLHTSAVSSCVLKLTDILYFMTHKYNASLVNISHTNNKSNDCNV